MRVLGRYRLHRLVLRVVILRQRRRLLTLVQATVGICLVAVWQLAGIFPFFVPAAHAAPVDYLDEWHNLDGASSVG